MTPQDIEKLKALCEKEGFELDFISRSTQGAMDIFRVEKKDKWDCDYIECIKDHNQGGLKEGMVLRALFLKNKSKRERVFESWEGYFEDHFKPSNKEAFDKFNESKNPIRVKINGFDIDRWNDIRIRASLATPYDMSVYIPDIEELKNHIEESIEAFLNRKP